MTLHYVCKPCALTCQLCVGFGALELLCMALCVLWLLELTGCGAAVAALSSHAGRHQRALPDKRARRKPGWLDGTIDPKTAAQLAIQHTTGIEVRSCLVSLLMSLHRHWLSPQGTLSSSQAKLPCWSRIFSSILDKTL